MTLEVRFVPLPPELVPAWRTGMLMLLDILQGVDTAPASDEAAPVAVEQSEEIAREI